MTVYETVNQLQILKAALPIMPPGMTARTRTTPGSVAFFI